MKRFSLFRLFSVVSWLVLFVFVAANLVIALLWFGAMCAGMWAGVIEWRLQ